MAETWVRVAGKAEVPEDGMIGVRVGDREIALYHLPGGEFCATDNVRAHEYAQLSDGWLEDGVIECPLHAGRSTCAPERGCARRSRRTCRCSSCAWKATTC